MSEISSDPGYFVGERCGCDPDVVVANPRTGQPQGAGHFCIAPGGVPGDDTDTNTGERRTTGRGINASESFGKLACRDDEMPSGESGCRARNRQAVPRSFRRTSR